MADPMEKRILKSIFYISLGFLIAMGGAAATNKKLYYKTHGIKTTATVLSKYKNLYADDPALKAGENRVEKIFILRLEFFDAAGHDFIISAPVYQKTWKKFPVNSTLEILYNPDDPGKDVIVIKDHRAVSIGLELLFILIGLLMIYFGLSILDKKEWLWGKRKKGAETGEKDLKN